MKARMYVLTNHFRLRPSRGRWYVGSYFPHQEAERVFQNERDIDRNCE